MDASARRSNAQQEANEKRNRAKRRQDRANAAKRAPDSAAKNTDYTKKQGEKVDRGRAARPRVSPAEANAKSAKAATNAGRQTPNSGPNARAQTLTGRRYGGLFGLRSK